MKYFLLLVGLFLVNNGYAASLQEDRFNEWLDIIDKPIQASKSSEEAAVLLEKTIKARIAAFNLQALSRVYSDLDKKFKDLKNDFKEIEDGLGAIDKWSTIHNDNELEKARRDWQKLIDRNWYDKKGSKKIKEYRSFLRKVRWPKEKEDKKYIAKVLEAELDKVDQTRFDFSSLESDTGLHEFRRILRWFLIEARVTNGGVQFAKSTSCPSTKYRALLNSPIADSKYGKLEANPKVRKPCLISQCLFLALVQAVEDFGALKDDIEKKIGNSHSDRVPAEAKIKAEKLYEEFLDGNPTSLLRGELRVCEE